MRRNRQSVSTLVIASALLAGALPALAIADEPAEHDHTHAAAPANVKPETGPAMAAMQHMHAMHEKMMAAKTPAERQVLMADHMKAMQEGMNSMQQMMSSSDKGAMPSQRLGMRMDMMTMMMQMMMDAQNSGAMPMTGMTPAASPK